MKKITYHILLLVCNASIAQNNALVINGAYIRLNNGTSSNPAYLVVNQSSTSGITRNSGWVVSEGNYNYIKWNAGTTTGSFVYPFGYSTTDYLPFTFNKTTASSSNISASTWSTNQQNVPHAGVSDNGTVPACYNMTGAAGDSVTAVIDRWWDIYATSSVTANLSFLYRGAENTTAVPTDIFKPQHWNGTYWDAPVGSGNTGVTSGVGVVTASGISDFSPYVLVRAMTPLPIELISFTGVDMGNYNLLSWQTATEINNDYFTLEKSADAINWQILSIVDGAGNSTAILNYNSPDNSPFNSITYYRLKQTDFDGTSKYSQIISISDENIKDHETFTAHDTQEGIIANINTGEDGFLNIYNSLGQLVRSKQLNKGNTSHLINTDNWSTGIYYIVLENSKVRTQKLYLSK